MSKPSIKTESDDVPLLLSRRDVAARLGVTVTYVRHLEKLGRLHGLRLTRSPTAMVFFQASDVTKLIEEASHD
jgi:hypothetical protein